MRYCFYFLAMTFLARQCFAQEDVVIDQMYLSSKSVHLAGYLSQCSFEDGVRISLADPNHTLFGYYGLAPRSQRNPLSVTEKKWVSACLLALTNATGTHVRVALRGAHRNLEKLVKGQDDFQLFEGAFYGDLFSGPQKKMYACQGDATGLAEALSTRKRVCSLDTEGGADPDDARVSASACGFEIMGLCREVCEHHDPRIQTYRGCRSPDGARYDQVIGVLLK